MTAILFDGFDHADSIDRWTSFNGNVVTSPVRTGTRAMRNGQNNRFYRDLHPSEEDDVIYVGFAYFGDTNTDTRSVLRLYENLGATLHINLIDVSASRGWRVQRGDGTILINTVPNVVIRATWHYIELGAKIADSGGWVELRQDGVAIARFDGDTQNGGTDQLIDRVWWGGDQIGGAVVLVDDIYIVNEQGTVNNSWLGDTRCYPLYPNGNGNYSELLGSDGNSTDNYLLVDEAGVPSSADYVGSATAGEKDSYVFEDLPVTVGTIRGVETRIYAAKTDTGTKQVGAVTRRAGTDDFGADHALSDDAFVTFHDIYELDPHAGPGAWTIPNVNATEWGAEVRA